MKHKGVRVVKETVDKEIHFLIDVDPRFVSLVRHGANQQPFRVIKSHKEGGDKDMGMIVQSILLPEGVTLEQLAAKKELAWLAEAVQAQKTDHGGYSKLIQKGENEFEENSLNLVKLDDSGAFAMVGKLLDPSQEKDSLAIGQRETEKIIAIPVSPMAMPIAEEPRPNFVITFGEMFEKELHSFLDVVRGSLSQSGADPKKRKKAIMEAADAFKGFLVIGLDALGTEAAKVDADITTAKEETPMFKDKDEFTSAVTEILENTVPGMVADTLKAIDDKAKETETTEEVTTEEVVTEEVVATEETAQPEGLSELAETVKELAATVSTLVTKQDELANQLQTDPGSQEETEETVVTKETTETEEEPSVFQGILFKKAS